MKHSGEAFCNPNSHVQSTEIKAFTKTTLVQCRFVYTQIMHSITTDTSLSREHSFHFNGAQNSELLEFSKSNKV